MSVSIGRANSPLQYDGACTPTTPREGVFPDMEHIKASIRHQILKEEPPYNVHDFYWDTGFFSWLAKHPVFENATLAVISLNAVWIAVDTDWNKASTITEAEWPFQAVEHSFCAYFTVEWITRFCAFKSKLNCRRDGWLVFDSILVFTMVLETWVMVIIAEITGGDGKLPFPTAILKLFRLLRLSRLLRMLRSFPELMILIRGMMTAMQSVAYVMCLQVLITYVFAILFTQLAGDKPGLEMFFSNVALSMYSLMVYATFLDNLADFMNAIRAEAPEVLPFAFIFLILSALTVMNMLIGVLCEVISDVADTERETMQVEDVKAKMSALIHTLDENCDMQISFKEFQQILGHPSGLSSLQSIGVNPEGIVDFAELFFIDDGREITLNFEQFMGMILDLRDSNVCKVKDALGLWKKIKAGLAINSSILVDLQSDLWKVKDDCNQKTAEAQSIASSILSELRSVASHR